MDFYGWMGKIFKFEKLGSGKNRTHYCYLKGLLFYFFYFSKASQLYFFLPSPHLPSKHSPPRPAPPTPPLQWYSFGRSKASWTRFKKKKKKTVVEKRCWPALKNSWKGGNGITHTLQSFTASESSCFLNRIESPLQPPPNWRETITANHIYTNSVQPTFLPLLSIKTSFSSSEGPEASPSKANQLFSNGFETLLRQHRNKQPLAGAAGRWVRACEPGALA